MKTKSIIVSLIFTLFIFSGKANIKGCSWYITHGALVYCQGAQINTDFSFNYENGLGGDIVFQGWYKNEVLITNNTTFIATEPGMYYCIYSDCYATSQNQVFLISFSSPEPEISTPVISLQKDNILQSTTAPYYQWYLNGNLIPLSNIQTIEAKEKGYYSVQTTIDATICYPEKIFKSLDFYYTNIIHPLVGPSPFRSTLTVQVPSVNNNTFFRLYNLAGIIVFEMEITSLVTIIPKGNLAPGMYLYRIENTSTFEITDYGKLLIQ